MSVHQADRDYMASPVYQALLERTKEARARADYLKAQQERHEFYSRQRYTSNPPVNMRVLKISPFGPLFHERNGMFSTVYPHNQSPRPVSMPRPQSPVMTRPQSPVMPRPQSPVMDRPLSAVMTRPQSPVMARPQSPVMARPLSAAMLRPQSPVMARPQSPVMARPLSAAMAEEGARLRFYTKETTNDGSGALQTRYIPNEYEHEFRGGFWRPLRGALV